MTDEQFQRIIAATDWDTQAVDTINTMLGVFERHLSATAGRETLMALTAGIRSEGPVFFRQQYRVALEKYLPEERVEEVIAGLEDPAVRVWSRLQASIASVMSKAGEEWGMFMGARIAAAQRELAEPPVLS